MIVTHAWCIGACGVVVTVMCTRCAFIYVFARFIAITDIPFWGMSRFLSILTKFTLDWSLYHKSIRRTAPCWSKLHRLHSGAHQLHIHLYHCNRSFRSYYHTRSQFYTCEFHPCTHLCQCIRDFRQYYHMCSHLYMNGSCRRTHQYQSTLCHLGWRFSRSLRLGFRKAYPSVLSDSIRKNQWYSNDNEQ